MTDIWSNIGAESTTQTNTGEWLYKVGADIRGPVPIDTIAQKLKSGELDLSIEVGKEGGAFHPVISVRAFAEHVKVAKKEANQRKSKKYGRLVLLITIPSLLVAAGAGYLIYDGLKKSEAERLAEALAKEQELAARREQMQKTPEMGLVALVSLGNEDSVKIRQDKPDDDGETKAKSKAKTAAGGSKVSGSAGSAGSAGTAGAAPSKPAPTEMVSRCQLSQADIFGTLKRNLASINRCVENERATDSQNLLPSTLELDFVVDTSGKVVDFQINDRHYRTGPLKNCMTKAFSTIVFPPSSGSNCPVTIPIKIGS